MLTAIVDAVDNRDWTVQHARIPDIAGVGDDGEINDGSQNVQGRWNPTLEDIKEEDVGDELARLT